MDQAEQTRQFRQALGSFATGVTIVTAFDEGPVGVTANSFNSVSLDPPLVLWSLARSSGSMQAFQNAGHFAVHILGAHQEDLSARFARSGSDKFEKSEWHRGVAGAPVLDDYSALFECRTVEAYDGGDHVIFVGQVLNFDRRDAAPLLFHAGRYAEARPKISETGAPSVLPEDGRFTQDFLMYLLSRAHFQATAVTRNLWRDLGLSEAEMLILSTLSMNDTLDRASLARELAHTGLLPEEGVLDDLISKGLIEDRGSLRLADAGRSAFIRILTLASAVEEELVTSLGGAATAELKALLRKVIEASASLSVSTDHFLGSGKTAPEKS
jgi:3-hydroxy-9,10-secoandrosta-1,3,5(10)-triene-9,17-dione monooxygenase reductase component